jgi:hypothetical protein
MKLERTVIYCPDELVNNAREKGMTNLSKFVREKLEEYNKCRGAPTSNHPDSTPEKGAV